MIGESFSRSMIQVSTIIIENGDDLSNHEININFIKQLLMRGVPVLYEEILSQLLHNQVSCYANYRTYLEPVKWVSH